MNNIDFVNDPKMPDGQSEEGLGLVHNPVSKALHLQAPPRLKDQDNSSNSNNSKGNKLFEILQIISYHIRVIILVEKVR